MAANLTYCIIGAHGFLGKHLVEQLILHTECKLHILTRNLANYPQKNADIRVFEGDLLVPASLDKFFTSGAIVINLAYLSADYETNLMAAKNLAASCNKHQIKQLLHISTAVVAGKSDNEIITEDTVCHPVNEYEKNKLALEKIFKQELNSNIILTILRPTAIFGKGGKNLLKIIHDFQKNSFLVEKLKFTVAFDRKMHLVAVENVVAAILYLIQHPINDSFIISDDDASNNNYGYVIQTICQAQKIANLSSFKLPFLKKLLPLILKLRHRTQSNPAQIYSCEKLKQIGFTKAIQFELALTAYIYYLLRSETK